MESGSRHLIEHVLAPLRKSYGDFTPIDLVTCYGGAPEGVDAVYRVADYRGSGGRGRYGVACPGGAAGGFV